jgi:type I restriction-modification system DNA methylase subunit
MNKVASITRQARQKKTAEVFTPDALVNEILDKLPKTVWEENKTFLDPAAGNGQFLVWVLIKKLSKGHTLLATLKSIYGVDLMLDNVQECRARLLQVASAFGRIKQYHIKVVLTNVVCANSLTYDFDFDAPPTTQELRTWTEHDWSDHRKELTQDYPNVNFPHKRKQIQGKSLYTYSAA